MGDSGRRLLHLLHIEICSGRIHPWIHHIHTGKHHRIHSSIKPYKKDMSTYMYMAILYLVWLGLYLVWLGSGYNSGGFC